MGLDMAVGIPAHKAKFRFAQKFDGVVSVALADDRLYVQYGDRKGKRYFKVFDLQHFSGAEDDEPELLVRDAEAQWRPMFLVGNLLHVYGKVPELIDVVQWQLLYSEYDGLANPGWSRDGRFVCDDGKIYRSYGWNDYGQGLDVVKGGVVVGHVDVDVQYFMPCSDGLIYGVRLSSPVFCIYSVSEMTVKLEVSLERYEFPGSTPRTVVSRFGDTLYVLAGSHVLVIDLKTFSVDAEFSYLTSDFMQVLLAGLKYKDIAFPHAISASEDTLVLSSSGSIGLVLCLSTVDGSLLWGRKSNWSMLAANTDGDLVFGLEERRPRAWDKYTGEEVWQASVGVVANTIQVGDNWVVYHPLSGDIQCFNWKKPYVSPYRPV